MHFLNHLLKISKVLDFHFFILLISTYYMSIAKATRNILNLEFSIDPTSSYTTIFFFFRHPSYFALRLLFFRWFYWQYILQDDQIWSKRISSTLNSTLVVIMLRRLRTGTWMFCVYVRLPSVDERKRSGVSPTTSNSTYQPKIFCQFRIYTCQFFYFRDIMSGSKQLVFIDKIQRTTELS